MWNYWILVSISVTFKLFMINFGRIQDVLFDVKYTDVDYHVFVDAAHSVYNGSSPFNRPGYRYSPIISWLSLPSVFYFEFGKVVFCIFDVLNCLIIYRLIRGTKAADTILVFCLFDPFSTIISSRGNAESVVQFTVLLTLYSLKERHNLLAILAHGLAIHLKLYPVIYLPSVFLSFLPQVHNLGQLLVNYQGVFHVMGTLAVNFLLNYMGYYCYGLDFLNEALLYHLNRSDIKHNFSPYFYPLYLTYDNDTLMHNVISKVAFLPQMALMLTFAINYRSDLLYCWFITTFAFVSFNKVCTSQYFVWYLSLFPLIWHQIDLSRSQIFIFASLWFSCQVLWLFFAYLLEFCGFNVFVFVWLASLLFLCSNVFILIRLNSTYARKVMIKKST